MGLIPKIIMIAHMWATTTTGSQVTEQQFLKDWQRLASKPRVRKVVLRLLPPQASEADLEAELGKVCV